MNSLKTSKTSKKLRKRAIDLKNNKVLLTSFIDSEQQQDLSLPPNCNGFGRIHHFNRFDSEGWIDNPLPMDPAHSALNLPYSDKIEVQLFQLSVCPWGCWYCFVGRNKLTGNKQYSKFLSAKELVSLYNQENYKPRILTISGGHPDLIPEWTIWLINELNRLGKLSNIYIWSDDNLSNFYLWKYLAKSDIKKLAGMSNYGRVGCVKGIDQESFIFNTGAEKTDFYHQFKKLKKLLRAGFNLYGYAIFTIASDKNILKKVANFVNLLQEKVHPNFPLRTIPLRIKSFTPMHKRMTAERKKSLELQWITLDAWKEEIKKRFSSQQLSKRIFEHELD